MASPSPQTIGSNLVRQLTDLLHSREEPSEFELRLLDRQADKLMMAEACEAYMVKAAIAALGWKIDEAVRLSEAAIRLRPDRVTLMNSALAMKTVNHFDRAQEYTKRAHEIAPKDPDTTRRMVTGLMSLGRFDEANEVYQTAKENRVNLDEVPQTEDIAALVAQIGVPIDRIRYELQCAHEVLKSNRKRVYNQDTAVEFEPDGGAALIIRLTTTGSLEEEMRLEADLADALAAEDGWNPCVFSVEIKCEEVHAYHAP